MATLLHIPIDRFASKKKIFPDQPGAMQQKYLILSQSSQANKYTGNLVWNLLQNLPSRIMNGKTLSLVNNNLSMWEGKVIGEIIK